MSYNETMLGLYRDFVIERHLIWEARQRNEPQPWTADPVLANRKFTNVFRVLDPGSQFVVTDLITPDPVDYLARCILYRYTNLPKTWYFMRSNLGRHPLAEDMNDTLIKLLQDYRDVGNTVFSGAYIIMPNPGVTGSDKIADAVNLTRNFLSEGKTEEFFRQETQKGRYDTLRSFPGIGKFMAMQILTDWGYGQPENRENDFIVAGPGAIKGAGYISDDKPEELIYILTRGWSQSKVVRLNGHPLSLMDTQNTLCEFSKYVRELEIPRKTSLYKPTHPGPQTAPTLPVWIQ